MLNMILADDEPIITKGILMLVDWERLGIRIAGVYEDGQKSLHGILTLEPDIAILDISMPGKNGIEILKELNFAGCKTKVIFLSGFQDFEYAQAALRYGAIDYLLKPVKKANLVSAIGKCVQLPEEITSITQNMTDTAALPPGAYRRLVDEKQIMYILVAVYIADRGNQSEMERQLTYFSLFGKIEQYIEQQELGIAFQKDGRIYLVFKNINRNDVKDHLADLQEEIRLSGFQMGFVMGPDVPELRRIAACVPECIDMLGYFYFFDQLDCTILETGNQVFKEQYTDADIKRLRDELVTGIVHQKRQQTEDLVRKYLRATCVISENHDDRAIYYLLSCIRTVEDRLDALDVSTDGSMVADTMDRAHSNTNYLQLSKVFTDLIAGYYEKISQAMQTDEKRDVISAKRYIEEHYAENITLETMAKHIHMNSFYFSSFFKKQTGQNFKDYLNQIRMKHAMELLMTTNKKSYEIAEEVGFKDFRYFSELFGRYYGKTPTAYRKELKEDT